VIVAHNVNKALQGDGADFLSTVSTDGWGRWKHAILLAGLWSSRARVEAQALD